MLSGDLGATARAARDGHAGAAGAAHVSTRSISCSRAPSRPRRRSSSGWAIRSGWRKNTTASAARCTRRATRVEFYSRELRRITGQFPDRGGARAENSRRLHRGRRIARVAGWPRAALRGIAKAARAQGRRLFSRRGSSGFALALRSDRRRRQEPAQAAAARTSRAARRAAARRRGVERAPYPTGQRRGGGGGGLSPGAQAG